MTVGVVLGAGGPMGWAYHLGVTQGVRDAIGREPANADRVIGTSAGAAIAATLLAGTPMDEVVEMITSPPTDQDRDQMRTAGADLRRRRLRALRPVAPGLVRRVRHVGAATALVGLLPAGPFPTPMLRRFAATTAWPERLWVPSVRLDDGQTVIFGRDHVPVTLGDALEASSAVPGVFQPKMINGARYVDGAVASSTHADSLVPEALDVVLISSADSSATAAAQFGPEPADRWNAKHTRFAPQGLARSFSLPTLQLSKLPKDSPADKMTPPGSSRPLADKPWPHSRRGNRCTQKCNPHTN